MTDPNPIIFIDDQTEGLPFFVRVAIWGIASGIISMLFYAKLSPQKEIIATQQRIKESRTALLRYDGPFAGLRLAIASDLKLALRQCLLILLPFLLAAAPVFVIMFDLSIFYDDTEMIHYGPNWLRSFEFWYLAPLMLTACILKRLLKVA